MTNPLSLFGYEPFNPKSFQRHPNPNLEKVLEGGFTREELANITYLESVQTAHQKSFAIELLVLINPKAITNEIKTLKNVYDSIVQDYLNLLEAKVVDFDHAIKRKADLAIYLKSIGVDVGTKEISIDGIKEEVDALITKLKAHD